MACEVEMNMKNGTDLTGEATVEEDSDNDILALKQSLKDKIFNEAVNGTINGNHDGASTSSTSSVINNSGTVENGIKEEKVDEGGEVTPVIRRQTPERTAKRKQGKTKKESLIQSKKQTPIKKVVSPIEEESTQSEKSFAGTESPFKEAEGDDTSTIDGLNDDEVIDVVNDDEVAVDSFVDISTEGEIKEVVADEKPKDVKGENVFYRWCNPARFSVSPRKQSVVSSSEGIGSYSSTYFESKKPNNSFGGISGRRALHSSSFAFESTEAEPSVSQNLKRKAQSESPGAPQRKHFISSLTERSPGWKFFSSPFTNFWSPNTKSVDTTVSSSTPLRQLHEDVDMEDSLTVNVNDSVDVSLHEDLEIEKEKVRSEKKILKEENFVAEGVTASSESNWRCIIM